MIRPGPYGLHNGGLPFAAVTGSPDARSSSLLGLAALIATAPAGAFSRQEVRIASTRTGRRWRRRSRFPDAPGARRRLAGGDRDARPRSESLDRPRGAQAMGLGERYAVLAYDARGHGESGGLVGIDGPKEVADVKAVFGWLRDRPGRRRPADRRLGRLVRRRRRLELARRRRAVGGARDLDLVDRPAPGAGAAGAREDGCHHGVRRRRSTRSASTPRCSRSATPPSGATCRASGRSPRLARRSRRSRASRRRSSSCRADATSRSGSTRRSAPMRHSPARSSSGSASTATRRPRASLRTRRRCSRRARDGSTGSSVVTRRGRCPSRSRSRPSAGAASRCATPACRRSSSADRPRFAIDTVPAHRSIAPRGNDRGAERGCGLERWRSSARRSSSVTGGRLRRLVADRRRAQRAHAGGQGDRRRRRRRADPRRHVGRTGSP